MSPGVGFAASGHRTTGSSVSVAVVTKDDGASASSTISLPNALVSSDLIVMVHSSSTGGVGTNTVNGTAMTLYGGVTSRNGSSTRMRVYSITGITGSYPIAYTTDSLANFNRYTVFVISGLTTSSITNSSLSDWSSVNTTTANTDEGTSSLSVVNGQVAIGVACASAGTVTFPSNSTPSSGWTSDRADGSGQGFSRVIHQLFTGSGTAQVNVQSTSTTGISAALYIVG